MPKNVRTIECCYCGGSTLLNLRDAETGSLKCSKCGANLTASKMAPVAEAPDAAGWNGERPSRDWQGKARDWRGDDDYEKPKRKKKKGFFDRLEDIWDEVEDIFD